MRPMATDYARILKFNPYHDKRGRFTSGTGRGGAGAAAEGSAEAIAADLYARAKEVEPAITADMNNAVVAGKLTGLEYAVKGKDSLTRKIADEAATTGVSPAVISRNIGDSVRYTVESTPGNYTHSVKSTLENLRASGYELVEFRNTWGQGKAYQGINTNLRHQRTGQVLELQFHTPQSFKTKQDINHKPYEEWRAKGTSEARKQELTALMIENQKAVEIPAGATDIRG